MTVESLVPLFKPKSVVVVGASRDPKSIGYRVLEALVTNRFNGPVYPVNPNADFVGSIKAFKSISEIKDQIDLAVITVPSQTVISVAEECAKAGVKALIVISAGFAETGDAGKQLQDKLTDIVRKNGMRMIGPNCMGFLNTDPQIQLNASFSPIFPPFGNIAMSSQSGALGLAIIALAKELNIGLSSFASVGNKADINGNDLIEYCEQDKNTDVILLYLESFGDPRRFSKLARRVGKTKPIVAVKGGRTSSGKRAAGSHTAALSSNDIVVDALFHQTGVIRADTLEEMFDIAVILSNKNLPNGKKVGILTNAGGPAILCADACDAGGLIVPELSEQTKTKLREFLPPAASVTNPVDMIASATSDNYHKAIKILAAAEEIDSLVVIYIPVDTSNDKAVLESISKGVSEVRSEQNINKPVLACLMAKGSKTSQRFLKAGKIPLYTFPEGAGRALVKVTQYSEWKRKPAGNLTELLSKSEIEQAKLICQNASKERGKGWLSAGETHELLKAIKLQLPVVSIATNENDAVKIASRIGFPVAMKLASHTIIHKTEIGGVVLNISSESQTVESFNKIRNKLLKENRLNEMEGVLIQPMITGGTEVMVGVTEESLFGPVIAFGLGGIHVEILKDISFRVTPISDLDAKEMIETIRGSKLLKGYRGHPPADIDALAELLLRISNLVQAVPEIKQLDLNPVFALEPGKGYRIADARIYQS
ncbi:MAG: acetate--CoA ligase family protein [Planctomycetes bacterium]|nr:acetate--CoA ligase family protein [Planctomycetota bacterium]